ncbi:MAG: dihydrolipoyl dehydrogenase, partial [Candidatus Bipolaricaulia bacterium]
YGGAIRAAQLGKQVILVEKDELGGVCLNVGCIPSKALIHAAGLVHQAKSSQELGISAQVEVDFARLQRWKESIVERLTDGIARLCRGNGVKIVQGTAGFSGPHEAVVATEEGDLTVEFEDALIATGSRPIELPGLQFDGELVLDSTDALALEEIPEELFIVGGGYIGLEIGTAYAKLGSRVTVVEMMDQLLPGTESELVRPVARRLIGLNVEVYLQSKVDGLERDADGAELLVETPEGRRSFSAKKILVTVGRRPSSAGLGLEEAGVELDDNGFIKVDERFRTTVEHIYAVGDVIGGPLLAHKAIKEGELAAEEIAGLAPRSPKAIPAAIFTDPEIAMVGLTEAEAREQGHEPRIRRFPYGALGRALTKGAPEGFIKLVADSDGRLLGAQIVGAGASELVSEAALAIEVGARLEDLARTIHPHPTLSEGLGEAAAAALGRPLHILPRRSPRP